MVRLKEARGTRAAVYLNRKLGGRHAAHIRDPPVRVLGIRLFAHAKRVPQSINLFNPTRWAYAVLTAYSLLLSSLVALRC
jgi:hypothetical protein